MQLSCHNFKKWVSTTRRRTSGHCVLPLGMFMLLLSAFWGILVSEAFEAPFFFSLNRENSWLCRIIQFGLYCTMGPCRRRIHPILDQRIRIVGKTGSYRRLAYRSSLLCLSSSYCVICTYVNYSTCLVFSFFSWKNFP